MVPTVHVQYLMASIASQVRVSKTEQSETRPTPFPQPYIYRITDRHNYIYIL